MPTEQPYWLTTKIRKYLEENGPSTAREMAADLGVDYPTLRARLGEMKKRGRAYIAGWRRDEDGGRLYPRALWGLGTRQDAPKPKPLGKAEYLRRHFRKKTLIVPSVFDLGTRVQDRRVTSKRLIKD